MGEVRGGGTKSRIQVKRDINLNEELLVQVRNVSAVSDALTTPRHSPTIATVPINFLHQFAPRSYQCTFSHRRISALFFWRVFFSVGNSPSLQRARRTLSDDKVPRNFQLECVSLLSSFRELIYIQKYKDLMYLAKQFLILSFRYFLTF